MTYKYMKLEVKNMSYSINPIIPSTYNLPFIVIGIGSEDNQQHILRTEGYPIPQIFICKSGEGTLKVNENIFTIKKDSFFYLMQILLMNTTRILIHGRLNGFPFLVIT